jgi:hypothetical protein
MREDETMADFEIDDQGTVVLFTPLSDAAKEFAAEAFANAMTFGRGYAVEHRYAPAIIRDLVEEQGFTIA